MNKNKTNQLIAVFASCKDENELKDLIIGLFTPQEIEEFSTRLEIVRLLKNGIPQREIAEKLGVGIATVSRGARELKNGRFKKV